MTALVTPPAPSENPPMRSAVIFVVQLLVVAAACAAPQRTEGPRAVVVKIAPVPSSVPTEAIVQPEAPAMEIRTLSPPDPARCTWTADDLKDESFALVAPTG